MSRIGHEINNKNFNSLVLLGHKEEVIFFPQMKPEKKSIELSDAEKTIFELMKKADRMELGELKSAAGLSGKQWDKGMKGLNKQGLVKIEADGDCKFCVLQS